MGQSTTGEPLIVDVHIDVALVESQQGRKKVGKLTWYYNGLCGNNLGLRVPSNHNGVAFRLSAASARKFVFKAPTITRNQRTMTEEYPDLNGEFDLKDGYVFITDLMINTVQAKVGHVSLSVDLRNEARVEGVEYDLSTFMSDPEMTNTGQES